jgi:alcohol dehydrogenase class IV
MAEASHLAGLAITKAGVGYVHTISHNLAARYHTAHGLTNAIVMPHVLDYSKSKCAARLARLARQCDIGNATQSDLELADLFIDRIRQMNASFGIPQHYEKLKAKDIPNIARGALNEARFTYGVPRYMDQGRCETLVQQLNPLLQSA